jgi:hypothetical protein
MKTQIEIDEDRSTEGFAAVKISFSNADDSTDPHTFFEVTVQVFVPRAEHGSLQSLQQAAMGKAKRFLMHI